MLLLSIAFLDSDPQFSQGFWIIGSAGHFLFTLTAVSRWISRTYNIQQLNPAWFIPVVGNVLVPIAGVEFFSKEISWFFFSVGMIFWLALFSLMIYRLGFYGELPAKLVPTLFILIAPPAVGFISYVKLTGQFDSTARVLLYMAIFTAVLMLAMLKMFLRLPFFLSWWAYTFPLCAFSISLVMAYRQTQIELFAFFSTIALAITTVVVAVVSIKTLALIWAGKLCVPEE
jgi:tellurite resistance protein